MTPESVMMMGTEAMKVARPCCTFAVGRSGHRSYHQYSAGGDPD